MSMNTKDIFSYNLIMNIFTCHCVCLSYVFFSLFEVAGTLLIQLTEFEENQHNIILLYHNNILFIIYCISNDNNITL